MTARVYSAWNPNAVGAGLALDQGNRVITTLENALDNSRKVLGELPKANAPAYYQTELWSTPRTSFGDAVTIGVATPISPLDQAVGADAYSCGYYPGNGNIIYNGTTLTTLDPIPERRKIGVYLIFAGGHAYVNFIVEGTWVYQVDLGTAGYFWLPAQTLSGGNAGELSSWTLFGGGGIAFDYPRIVAPPT